VRGVPLGFRRDRRILPEIGNGGHVLVGKDGRVCDSGGLGNRLVGKVTRRVGRRAEILAAIGRHLDSKCRNSRQRKAGGCERNLEPDLHDFSPLLRTSIAEIGTKGEYQFLYRA
jgi:hypothetical protein